MDEKKKIEWCIEMISFGMKTTLVRFQDKYFNYVGTVKGDDDNEDSNGLATRAFESAFCVDLCATYVFEMADKLLKTMGFKEIYRDNGILVSKEGEQDCWMRMFQVFHGAVATRMSEGDKFSNDR
eukprot:8899382-Ditylum_brightwellii.AAC.1